MDVGLEGNVFTRNYGALEFLVEHSWWKHTWRLCYTFNCKLVINSDYLPLNPRESDHAIMELFINSGLWAKHHLIILNRVRRFKNIYFFLEALCAGGKPVDPAMLINCKGRSSRAFSTEHPTLSNLTLWRTALKDLISDTYTLQSLLGPFLQMPSTNTCWQISADNTRLYRRLPNGSLGVYTKHGQTTRQRKFVRQGNTPTLSTAQYRKLATVFTTHLDSIVSFHSSTFKSLTFQPPASSVLNVLKSWKNPHL